MFKWPWDFKDAFTFGLYFTVAALLAAMIFVATQVDSIHH